MTLGVVIAAAGRGTRLGAARPKALLMLGGVTLLERAFRIFLDHSGVGPVAAVVPDPDAAARAMGPVDQRVRLVRGGATRQESVRSGLEALPETDLVLVHDAARPFPDPALIDAVIEAARRHGAAIPGMPVSDTVKRIFPSGQVDATVARDDLVLAQTPQGFRTELLRRAHAEAARLGVEGTDDAALVERLGLPVFVVPGSRGNIKITTREDLALAEAMLGMQAPGGGRRDA